MATLMLKLCGNSTLKYFRHTTNGSAIGFAGTNFRFKVDNLKANRGKDVPYITRLALPPDYDNVTEFMCENYYKHEPVIINSGLADSEAPPIWRVMMREQVQAGYSIIAETPDNCLIGVALNTITTANDPQRQYTLAKCCDAGPISNILEFFAYLSEMPGIWERYCVSVVFEQCSLAVDSRYQNLGIATRLVQESWILARDCGFRVFRLDCNSIYCEKIARGFGWSMIWSIPFGQFVKDGEIVFKCVKEPHTVCHVFVDELRYCKTYCVPYKQCKTVTPPPV